MQSEKLLQITKWLTNPSSHQQFPLTGGFDAWTAACCHRRGINPWCSVYISPHLLSTSTLMYCSVYISPNFYTYTLCLSSTYTRHPPLRREVAHISGLPPFKGTSVGELLVHYLSITCHHVPNSPLLDNYLSIGALQQNLKANQAYFVELKNWAFKVVIPFMKSNSMR